jgi:hypothetical protein
MNSPGNRQLHVLAVTQHRSVTGAIDAPRADDRLGHDPPEIAVLGFDLPEGSSPAGYVVITADVRPGVPARDGWRDLWREPEG